MPTSENEGPLMKPEIALIQGTRFPVYSLNTLVIGSGAAALKAALSLYDRGQHSIALVTEKWGGGASNNSGSDKQTYYKLSVSGSVPDAPGAMARDLYDGGCMHGDIALCEAQHSAQAFFELVQLGVPFPHDRYGGYAGYRTDHDQRGRATSAGPLTSRYMFEALAKQVVSRNIPVLDRHQVMALFAERQGESHQVMGAAALNLAALERDNFGLVLFNAVNIILATGGPGGLYEWSVYPEDQIGSIGIALQIGAIAHNLTESQFGLASLKHRWNVSGSYQQVMPRYVSTDAAGNDPRDFLTEHFPDMGAMATAIFRKGYQWPFDPGKIAGHGSSLIDLAVYQETTLRGRMVYLDFMHNPAGGGVFPEFDWAAISMEAREYLEKSHAMQATPIERLAHLNPQAIDLYRAHGIDLARDLLAIAGCAQHNNGGLRANVWWESNVQHLFPIGEVNGTHGVYRPGGAALNAGQVGALRAAMYIAARYRSAPPEIAHFMSGIRRQLDAVLEQAGKWLSAGTQPGQGTTMECRSEIQQRMSRHGAQIRTASEIGRAISEAWHSLEEIERRSSIEHRGELPGAFRTRELALTHAVYLEAIGEYVARGGKSRGSYLVRDPDGDQCCSTIGDDWRYFLADQEAFVSRHILELAVDAGRKLHKQWVPVRPLPVVDRWFENVWREYRDGAIFEEAEA
jgi:succinate dehydrogenase/fumarate reductase flavoprotein subunit